MTPLITKKTNENGYKNIKCNWLKNPLHGSVLSSVNVVLQTDVNLKGLFYTALFLDPIKRECFPNLALS